MMSESDPNMRSSTFEVLSHTAPGPRRGRFIIPGRHACETPHYTATTSRGAVPHLAQDTFTAHTSIKSVHVALEDCKFSKTVSGHETQSNFLVVESLPKSTPPIVQLKPHLSPTVSPLRSFIALPPDNLLILGPRRCCPIPCPVQSTDSALGIYTSIGFQSLPVSKYLDISHEISPDILLGPADLPSETNPTLFSKRMKARIVDRTRKWMSATLTHRANQAAHTLPALFAPILPLPIAAQASYIDFLTENHAALTGLAVYNTESLSGLPEALTALPRLSFTNPSSPQAVLAQVSAGIDIFTLPFIAAATDAGIAFCFDFPAAVPDQGAGTSTAGAMINDHTTSSPLGMDMWSPSHAQDPSPLQRDCKCYACTAHSRAYIHHCLVAKEMLGWVLLQIHNHAVVDRFFTGIRSAIEDDTFSARRVLFEEGCCAEFPAGTGKGPR